MSIGELAPRTDPMPAMGQGRSRAEDLKRRWDFATSVEEVMTHLHAYVMARQVLYLGISDAPAWVVVKANECKQASSGGNLYPHF